MLRLPMMSSFHVGNRLRGHADRNDSSGLNLLKSGGRLRSIAPNRDGCSLQDQLWFESAPPPDVVTLFPPGFCRDRFGEDRSGL